MSNLFKEIKRNEGHIAFVNKEASDIWFIVFHCSMGYMLTSESPIFAYKDQYNIKEFYESKAQIHRELNKFYEDHEFVNGVYKNTMIENGKPTQKAKKLFMEGGYLPNTYSLHLNSK